jgi:hypothetical protein
MITACCAVLNCAVPQVKVAEHVLTRHKVAIKILNRRKIQAMDMEEKGAPRPTLLASWYVLRVPALGRHDISHN